MVKNDEQVRRRKRKNLFTTIPVSKWGEQLTTFNNLVDATNICHSPDNPLRLPEPSTSFHYRPLPRYCLINHVVLIKARLIEFADFTPLIRVSFKLNEASFHPLLTPYFVHPCPAIVALKPEPPSNRSFSLAVLLIFIPSGYRVLLKRFTKR